MILKHIDDALHNKQIRILDTLLQNSISEPQKQLIRLERTKLQNGYKAEKDNA